MKRSTFRILFYIKRSKLLKNGFAPVYMKVTVNGKSAEVSLKRSIPPRLWDTSRNIAKGNSQEAQQLNDYLTSVRGQIFMHQKELQEDGIAVTAKNLINAFLGLGRKRWTIIELFEEHNKNMELLVGADYSPLTLQRYRAALKHIVKFCKLHYGTADVLLTQIDHKFITAYEFYLKTEIGCQHNSAMKHMKALKKIVRIALANDYLRKDPFVHFKITHKKINREYLVEAEIRKIMEKDLPIQRVAAVRDIFVFQCFTGLAYKDIKNLAPGHIQLGIDGKKWIYLKRGKTGVPCHIPLLPIAEQLLHKYAEHPCRQLENRLFPVPSNQKMNAYLKEVGDLCGIDKSLHTHLARHTYATVVTLSNGIPIETVQKLMGHSKLQTTQIYAKVLATKISKDVENLRKKRVI